MTSRKLSSRQSWTMPPNHFWLVVSALATPSPYLCCRQYLLSVQCMLFQLLIEVLWSCLTMYDLLPVVYHYLSIHPHRTSEQQDWRGSRANLEASLRPNTITGINTRRNAMKQLVPVCWRNSTPGSGLLLLTSLIAVGG